MAITAWKKDSPVPENAFDHKPLSESQELHVLAVDDSLVDRKVIERLLKISSCKVTAVESGSSALQYLGLDGEKGSVGFDDSKVNLIMTDYSMPGMTGYELLRKLKQTSSELKKIPVVIMSSENIMARIDRCLEEGAEDFLVKPVKLSDVKRLKDYILKGDVDNKENPTHKRKITDDDDSSSPPLPTQKLEEDPSSVLPPSSQLLPAHLSCDPSASALAFSSSSSSSTSISKRPRIMDHEL